MLLEPHDLDHSLKRFLSGTHRMADNGRERKAVTLSGTNHHAASFSPEKQEHGHRLTGKLRLDWMGT